VYVKNEGKHVFNYDLIDRVPYMSKPTKDSTSRFVTEEKFQRGKALTDVWWRSVIGTASKERTGFPTQKPVDIVERLVKMHSTPTGKVLDFFAGSGTTGVAAHKQGREFTLIDKGDQAIQVMKKRFEEEGILVEEADCMRSITI
jgi:site-specific DNA-methyltransferase (adenine-specific)